MRVYHSAIPACPGQCPGRENRDRLLFTELGGRKLPSSESPHKRQSPSRFVSGRGFGFTCSCLSLYPVAPAVKRYDREVVSLPTLLRVSRDCRLRQLCRCGDNWFTALTIAPLSYPRHHGCQDLFSFRFAPAPFWGKGTLFLVPPAGKGAGSLTLPARCNP